MKNFAYKALKASGETVEGIFEAGQERELNDFFVANELTPLRVVEQKAGSPMDCGRTFRTR